MIGNEQWQEQDNGSKGKNSDKIEGRDQGLGLHGRTRVRVRSEGREFRITRQQEPLDDSRNPCTKLQRHGARTTKLQREYGPPLHLFLSRAYVALYPSWLVKLLPLWCSGRNHHPSHYCPTPLLAWQHLFNLRIRLFMATCSLVWLRRDLPCTLLWLSSSRGLLGLCHNHIALICILGPRSFFEGRLL